jgi:hypothetical protein
MAKIYKGQRTRDGEAFVTVTEKGGATRKLDPRLDLHSHSPNGFEWGYSGSGPAQLALAICADCLGDDPKALRVHQDFKRLMISCLEGDDWQFTEQRVRDAIEDCQVIGW